LTEFRRTVIINTYTNTQGTLWHAILLENSINLGTKQPEKLLLNRAHPESRIEPMAAWFILVAPRKAAQTNEQYRIGTGLQESLCIEQSATSVIISVLPNATQRKQAQIGLETLTT
jgi:hypothetical protein